MTTKEQVLAMLLDSTERAVSGEELARESGVSRNAVWKAVRSLRMEGHQIEACTNRGYRLIGEHEPISEAGIRSRLETQRFGQVMEVRSVIDSTNARAKVLAVQGAQEGTMVAARGQTHGRGRMGRRFHSPEDHGVYVSFVLRPRMSAEKAVMLTVMSAVATARAIERVSGIHPGIKWVNDIILNDRKVAGILCEAEVELEAGKLAYAVVGIGINVSKQSFPEELKDIAISIEDVCDHAVSCNRLIAELCRCMEEVLQDPYYLEEYRARSITVGKKVRVVTQDSIYTARALSIDESGGLVIRTEFGERVLKSGEIRVVEEKGK